MGNLMRIAYIKERRTSEGKRQFEYVECSCTRKITSRSDKLYSKLFHPIDFEDAQHSTKMLTENEKIMIVREPVFIDKTTIDLCDRMKQWVEWANQVKESDYNPFAADKSTGGSE